MGSWSAARRQISAVVFVGLFVTGLPLAAQTVPPDNPWTGSVTVVARTESTSTEGESSVAVDSTTYSIPSTGPVTWTGSSSFTSHWESAGFPCDFIRDIDLSGGGSGEGGFSIDTNSTTSTMIVSVVGFGSYEVSGLSTFQFPFGLECRTNEGELTIFRGPVPFNAPTNAALDSYVIYGTHVATSGQTTWTVNMALRRTDCSGAPDSDGDDFDDCEEIDAGSDPTDPNSTPDGGGGGEGDPDKDGFIDDEDECPVTFGTYRGCPPPILDFDVRHMDFERTDLLEIWSGQEFMWEFNVENVGETPALDLEVELTTPPMAEVTLIDTNVCTEADPPNPGPTAFTESRTFVCQLGDISPGGKGFAAVAYTPVDETVGEVPPSGGFYWGHYGVNANRSLQIAGSSGQSEFGLSDTVDVFPLYQHWCEKKNKCRTSLSPQGVAELLDEVNAISVSDQWCDLLNLNPDTSFASFARGFFFGTICELLVKVPEAVWLGGLQRTLEVAVEEGDICVAFATSRDGSGQNVIFKDRLLIPVGQPGCGVVRDDVVMLLLQSELPGG